MPTKNVLLQLGNIIYGSALTCITKLAFYNISIDCADVVENSLVHFNTGVKVNKINLHKKEEVLQYLDFRSLNGFIVKA